MIELDVRLVVIGICVAVATAATPLAIGGGIAAAGLLAAILAARSVVRGDEGSVTFAIVIGGLVAAGTAGHGRLAAMLVGAGVFVGAELAALGRRLGIDPEAPAGPEVLITLSTIGLGIAAGALVGVVSLWRAAPPLANAMLVLLVLLGGVAFVVRQLRHGDG